MKLENPVSAQACRVCGEPASEQPSFAFPELPSQWPYSALHGKVHVHCLLAHREVDFIRLVLATALRQYCNRNARVLYRGSVGHTHLLENPRLGEFEVWDFGDFAEFPIAYAQVDELLHIGEGDSVSVAPAVRTRLRRAGAHLLLEPGDQWSLPLSMLSTDDFLSLLKRAWVGPADRVVELRPPSPILRGAYLVSRGAERTTVLLAPIMPGLAWITSTDSDAITASREPVQVISMSTNDDWLGTIREAPDARAEYADDSSGGRLRTGTDD